MQGLWLGGEIGGQGAGFSLGDAGVGQPFAQNSLVTEAAGTPEGRLRRPQVPVSDVALSKAGALFTGEHGEGVVAALDGGWSGRGPAGTAPDLCDTTDLPNVPAAQPTPAPGHLALRRAALRAVRPRHGLDGAPCPPPLPGPGHWGLRQTLRLWGR